MQSKIRVLLADDHILVSQGFAALLAHEEDIAVVAQVADGQEALDAIGRLVPDVALVDLSMPRMSGIELLRKVGESGLATKVIILSRHEDLSLVKAAIDAGASGYIVKSARIDDLAGAVRACVAGKLFLSKQVAAIAERALPGECHNVELTARERDVLRLLAHGLSSKQIGSDLGISTRTVDNHRAAIMRKLAIDNVPGLVKYAIQLNLVTLD